MSAILVFWVAYGAVMLCGFAWMFWHAEQNAKRRKALRDYRRDHVAVRLMMEGKQ